jgi:hypothetical protein
MDYTTITDAIDFAGVVTGVGVAAVAIGGVLIAKRGARMLLSMIGR